MNKSTNKPKLQGKILKQQNRKKKKKKDKSKNKYLTQASF